MGKVIVVFSFRGESSEVLTLALVQVDAGAKEALRICLLPLQRFSYWRIQKSKSARQST